MNAQGSVLPTVFVPNAMQRTGVDLAPDLSWWGDASPGLMNNKTIRNFLLQYSHTQHPEVVKLTTLYGILCLQNRKGTQPLSLAEIRKLVKEGFFNQTLGTTIEGVKSSVNDIQHIIGEFARQVDGQEQAEPSRNGQKENKPSSPERRNIPVANQAEEPSAGERPASLNRSRAQGAQRLQHSFLEQKSGSNNKQSWNP